MEKTIEKFQFIFLVAGIGFFALAFIVFFAQNWINATITPA